MVSIAHHMWTPDLHSSDVDRAAGHQLWSSFSKVPKEASKDKADNLLEDERHVESSLSIRPRPLSLMNDKEVVTANKGPIIQNNPSNPWSVPARSSNDANEVPDSKSGGSSRRSSDPSLATVGAESPYASPVSSAPSELSSTMELTCHQSEHGVDGLINVKLSPGNESITIILKVNSGKTYEGVLRAEGSVESQDIRDACDSFYQGSIRVYLDKLKIIGVGFQVKLKEKSKMQAEPQSLEAQVQLLSNKVESLTAALEHASRPSLYDVPPEELRFYGWEIDPATKYGPNGQVPDDDMYWRGNYTGKVRAALWCGRVILEGQVSGVGPGMRKHSERPLGTTAYSEVTFPVFRLPPQYRPREVQSFSRRALDLGHLSSEYIGGVANGVIDYRPLRRLDVLPDGFIVLVTCLHVKTSLRRVLNRPTRWCISFRHIQFFLDP